METSTGFKSLCQLPGKACGSSLGGSVECLMVASQDVPSLADALEKNYKEKRDELLQEDGITITPLKVLKDRCFDVGAPLEVTTFEVHLPAQSEMPEKTRFRVILQASPYLGHGEATRHRLALQLAAADLLEKVKAQGIPVAEYGLLPGCRINPRIYGDLRELCRMESLASYPQFSQMSAAGVGSDELYAFKCMIGQAETTGCSDSIFLAKRLAAQSMYEMLTGEKYPDDRTASGSGCLRFEDLQAMGINPIRSVRSIPQAKGARNDQQSIWEGSQTTKKRTVEIDNDLFDDDYAEEEDNVVIMRNQLRSMKIKADA